MKERLQQRLEELRAEFAAGQQMMATLEAQHAHLKSSLLRINGAMQVLEELLSQEPADDQPVPGHELLAEVRTAM
jgi:prefoldin subunit 5